MPTVLVVDDCEALLRVREALLQRIGFNVVACQNPLQALCSLQAQRPDVIITDYEMPQIDGLSFSLLARACGFGGPIILSTASHTIPAHALDVVSCVVEKSTQPHYLVRAILAEIHNRSHTQLSLGSERPARKGKTSCHASSTQPAFSL